MKKKILMIVYNHINSDGRVIRAAEALSKNFEIDVFCIKFLQEYRNDSFNTIKVNSRFKGFISILKFWLQVLFFIIKNRHKYEIIYLHDYYLPILVYLKYFLPKKIKFIYDAHELIIDELNTKRDKIFAYLEKISIYKFDAIIAANDERAILMHKYYNLLNKPISIKNISKVDFNSTEIRLYTNKINLVYQGYIDYNRGIKFFLDAMLFLDDRFFLTIIGDGPDLNNIKNFIKENSLENNIECVGKVSLNELYSLLKNGDIGIITYSYEGLNNIYCSPNKIYEYAQSGLVVLSTSQPSIKNILKEYPIGITVDEDILRNSSELANSIEDIVRGLCLYKNNLENFNKFFNYENESKKLIKLVSGLI